MSEQKIKDSISKRERNVDALFGVLHVKDRPYLHQRTAQHIFGESDSAIVVPFSTVSSVWDQHSSKGKRILKIAFLSLVVTGLVGYAAYLFRLNPGFLIPFL